MILSYGEWIWLLVELDTHNQSHGQHIDQQRGPAIADKGQRNSGKRHNAYEHTDVFEDLKHKHGNDASHNISSADLSAVK